MIIGPQGTPYENGCFLFDIYLPDSYNTNSPKVQSMTTNGGLYRYNPNLYADGVSSTESPAARAKLTELESMPQSAWHVARARVDFWEIDVTASLDLNSVTYLV
jgi:hypothetical protein